MSGVFMGGSRSVSRLNRSVVGRLNSFIEKGIPVLVGDANGADKAIQRHLHARAYDRVDVFCTEARCRNNVGGWPIRSVEAGKAQKGREFFAAKDRQMALEADMGLMIWNGKSAGTLLNVWRLASQQKPVAVYLAPKGKFLEIGSGPDVNVLLALCPVETRKKVERQLLAERPGALEATQSALL